MVPAIPGFVPLNLGAAPASYLRGKAMALGQVFLVKERRNEVAHR